MITLIKLSLKVCLWNEVKKNTLYFAIVNGISDNAGVCTL